MKKKVILGFASTPTYSGNTKALYEQINMNYSDKYECVWCVKNNIEKKRLEKNNINVISEEDENFSNEFKKIEIMFITHDQFIDKKTKLQTFISLWHGFGPKRSGYALTNDIYEKEFCNKYSNVIDYLCVSSEFSKMIFSYVLNIDDDKIIIYPSQRNKYIFENKGKENIKNIIDKDINRYKKILLYAPTFRNGIGKEEGKLNVDNALGLIKYNEKDLNKYLEENEYLLIIKLHPSEETKINTDKFGENIILLQENKLIEKNISINEILSGIDCLITDYSSIYTDFILTEKPVIFLNTDIEKYNKKRGIYFDSEKIWFPGPVVNNIVDFKEEVTRLFQNKNYYKEERKEYNKLVNGTEPENTNKFIEEFINQIGTKRKIPPIINYIKDDKFNKNELKNIEQWKRKLKNYKFVEWNLSDLKTKERYEKYKDKTLFKLSILYDYGGLFIEPSIQIIRDLEDLCINSEYLFIIDKYGKCITDVIGSSKNNEFVKECLNRKWFGINSDEKIFKYQKSDLFFNVEEQYEFSKNNDNNTKKYFNNSKITMKNKIGRALKYGFNI